MLVQRFHGSCTIRAVVRTETAIGEKNFTPAVATPWLIAAQQHDRRVGPRANPIGHNGQRRVNKNCYLFLDQNLSPIPRVYGHPYFGADIPHSPIDF